LSVQKDPNNPTFHYHLGLAYSTNGQTQLAAASLEKAIRLRPDFPEVAEARSLLTTLKKTSD
jgi:cytochrome c-type biogenesis protein CcmH/NrfG